MIKYFANMNETDFKFFALKELCPNGFSGNLSKIILPEGSKDTIPTKKQLDDKIAELKAEWDAQAYARARQPLYPAIGDQLDDLYHKGAFSAEMKAKIKKVKDDNPKPE